MWSRSLLVRSAFRLEKTVEDASRVRKFGCSGEMAEKAWESVEDGAQVTCSGKGGSAGCREQAFEFEVANEAADAAGPVNGCVTASTRRPSLMTPSGKRLCNQSVSHW